MKISNLVINREKSNDKYTFATVDIDETGWFKTKKETVEIFADGDLRSSAIHLSSWRLVSDGSLMPKQDAIDGLVRKLKAESSTINL